MEIINTNINNEKLNEMDNISKDMCFFDIETTGLNRRTDIIYLIGILYFDKNENSWIISQYFANNLKDEPELILKAARFIMNFKYIINYNGNSFDIPFVNHKLETYKLPIKIDKSKSLDLYSTIRKDRNLLEIKNLKLKTVEQYLGIYREDIYSGKDCIKFYKDYILNNDLKLKNKLLTHNFEDLYYLADIMKIFDIINKKKTFIIHKGNKIIKVLIIDIITYKDKLILEGTIKGLNEKLIYYGNDFDLIIEDTNKFQINIYTNEGLVTPDQYCKFIYRDELGISENLKPTHSYQVPNEIFILKIGRNYLLEDIMNLLKEILRNII